MPTETKTKPGKIYIGTGRRKTSVARVRVTDGTGRFSEITVNVTINNANRNGNTRTNSRVARPDRDRGDRLTLPAC